MQKGCEHFEENKKIKLILIQSDVKNVKKKVLIG